MNLREGLLQFIAFVLLYIGGNAVWNALSGAPADLSLGLLGKALVIGATYILVIYFLRKKSS